MVLSAQATDVGVNRATKTLFPKADTPRKMIALGEEALREAIKTVGLLPRQGQERDRPIEDPRSTQHGGGRCRARARQLEALPGVGRKTANVVMNVAFGEETIAVDTHIFRVANRLGIAPGRNPLEVELGLGEGRARALQSAMRIDWLILHGRYICVARQAEMPRLPHRGSLPLRAEDDGGILFGYANDPMN